MSKTRNWVDPLQSQTEQIDYRAPNDQKRKNCRADEKMQTTNTISLKKSIKSKEILEKIQVP
jgi:hypothetical protein